MDRSQFKDIFIQETYARLSSIAEKLDRLEAAQPSADGADLTSAEARTTDGLFRCFHSIKGMSSSMGDGYEPMKELAHTLENLLETLRQGKKPVSTKTLSALSRAFDIMKEMVSAIEQEKDIRGIDIRRITEELNTLSITEKTTEASTSREYPREDKRGSHRGDNEQSHRRKLQGVTDEIKYSILTAPALSLDNLIQAISSTIKDLSKKRGKNIDLKLQGVEINIPAPIIETITSPLIHILGNAIDHGMESPEQRKLTGKPKKGLIAINASYSEGNIIIEVRDDGRGIDTQRIRERAINAGMDENSVKTMSHAEALMLVCVPGISGSDTLTHTSGRGVGMDAVKEAVESAGGRLEIKSTQGNGTSVIMTLPHAKDKQQ